MSSKRNITSSFIGLIVRVRISAAVFPEWFVCVFLLCFIAVTNDEKDELTRDDIKMLAMLPLSIVFGWFLFTTSNFVHYCVYMILSCACAMYYLYPVIKTYRALAQFRKPILMDSFSYKYKYLLAQRKTTIFICLSFIVVLFPAWYFAQMFGFISNAYLHSALMISSCFSKVIFASLCIDAHLEISSPSAVLMTHEIRMNSSRRSFLRY